AILFSTSRRRHTRFSRDWSSDVCSSDLGGVVHERARLVVGADGLHSRVAKEVGAPVVEDRGILQCAYYTYWSGVEVGGMEAFVRDDTGAAAIPTNDGLPCIPVVWPR